MDLYNPGDYSAPSYYECSIDVSTDTDLLKRDERVKFATFRAMNTLEGWCTKFKASILIDLVFMISDILHIDGNHSEATSLYDVKKWTPLVKPGGLIIFDDTTWGTTGRAVQWLDENCCKLGEYHEDNDWGIWIKI